MKLWMLSHFDDQVIVMFSPNETLARKESAEKTCNAEWNDIDLVRCDEIIDDGSAWVVLWL